MPVDERISAGQPVRFSAARENLFAEVAGIVKGSGVPLGGAGGVLPYGLPVEFKNTTGGDRVAGDLVGFNFDAAGLTGSKFDPPKLYAVAVSEGTHAYTKGVVIRPAVVNKGGVAILAGLVWATVNVTHADHPFAIIDNGNNRYKSSALGGDVIFAKPAGTGVKLCAVLVNTDCHRVTFGTAVGTIPAGASGTFSIVGPPVLTPAEDQVCWLDRMDEGKDVEPGDSLAVKWIPLEHRARIMWAVCPPDPEA